MTGCFVCNRDGVAYFFCLYFPNVWLERSEVRCEKKIPLKNMSFRGAALRLRLQRRIFMALAAYRIIGIIASDYNLFSCIDRPVICVNT